MEVNWGNVESYSEVQSVNGLTGKVQLNIPTKTSDLVNDSGFVSNSNFATKAELKQVENKIPNVSNFATKSDVSNSISVVEAKIPDTSNFATKAELPTEYVKSVNSANNALTFTTNSNNTVEYKPIIYVNATMAGLAYRHTSDLKNYYIEGLTPITADATYVEIKNDGCIT